MSETDLKGGTKTVYHSRIRDWPVAERPREKLMHHGSGSLSDAELLAIILRSGVGGVTALDLAKEIIKKFGSLSQLATRNPQDLRQFRGLGNAKAAALVAVFELSRRMAIPRQIERPCIHSPEDIARMYQPIMRDLRQEIFKVILLDSANHYLRDVDITVGTLNSSLVHPREVYRPAISEPAASIVLLHNHPSGNPDPSQEDIQVTAQLVDAGKIIGIPVHDHVIIAGHRYASFAERGLI